MTTNSNLPNEIIAAIQKVIGNGKASLHEPKFDGNEYIYIQECIESTYVSSIGKYVLKFEKDLEEITNSKYAVAVMNGTAALHIALLVSGISRDDEVLVPNLTFVATANAVSYCGAIPHLVDAEPDTLGIDPTKLLEYLRQNTLMKNGQCINKETRRVIRAMVPMHTFGHPSKIEELLSISREFKIELIEDAAESLGSYYKNQHTGTFGKIGILSFNGNKIVTTGGGGAILTNDYKLAKLAKHITTTAKVPHSWEYSHDQVAFNYRMPNINAALGCAQLESLTHRIEQKRRLFTAYQKEFLEFQGIHLMQEPTNCRSNYWLNTLILTKPSIEMRNKILTATNEEGIQTRPAWNLMGDLDIFRNSPRMDLSASKRIFESIINIPSSPGLLSE